MRAALALAQRGLGNVWPNPAVGCVIVNDGRVVGRGWTQPGGRPHAETEALARAGPAVRGGTAYVTLEPCCHWGRTPRPRRWPAPVRRSGVAPPTSRSNPAVTGAARRPAPMH
jgi:diaminohydroxyphosphoribosylaminopyrimidine deaminase/5-amino-6-(5-phosphoribosylamino)uracil reductase